MADGDTEQPIIVKKIKKSDGHHGGAWKVAYADFVTAMMAFFLLLWLLNVSTDEQREAISSYFDPTHPKVSSAESGAGGVLGGLSMQPKGSMATAVQPITMQRPSQQRMQGKQLTPKEAAEEAAKEKKRKEEEAEFKKVENQIRQAIQESPELKKLQENLLIDMTPEGLRIQIIDKDGEPMFPSGSAQMFQKMRDLVRMIADVIMDVPNELSLRGHTDSVPYASGATYTNWELSTDRANAVRRAFLEDGIPKARLNNVQGKADREPLIEDNPADPRNRRISIILLKEELTNPEAYQNLVDEGEFDESFDEESEVDPTAPQVPIGTFRKTPGKIEFP